MMNIKESIIGLPLEQEGASLWVAPLPKPKYILVDHHMRPFPSIFSYEIYTDIARNPAYARVYGIPAADHVPTLIIGDMLKLVTYSYHDRQPLIPLYGNIPLPIIEDLPGMKQILTLPKLGYFFRPTTFVLMERKPIIIEDNPAVAKIHRKMVGSSRVHEFFAHIFSEVETIALANEMHGLLLTNSADYVSRHSELQFDHV